jgi:hypothetical protein
MIGNDLNVGDQLVDSFSSSQDVQPLAWIHDGKLNVLLICKVAEPRAVRLGGIAGQLEALWIDNTIPWTTPSMQMGLINSTQPLNLQGYTVALLQTAS